ncbi:MAG: RNA polymerase sigma factor [Acidimicrobiales bacterium]
MAEGELAELVAAAKEGDGDAWRALVARYVDLVWAIARGHSLDHCDAADVTQTTWLRLHEQLPRLAEPDRVGAWLATTARRESLRVLRERRRLVPQAYPFESSFPMPAEPPADEALPAIQRDSDRLVWRAFEQLTPACQRLLRAMTADPPLSYADLSTVLDMPVGSIGPTRARCLDRLRANLSALSGPHVQQEVS